MSLLLGLYRKASASNPSGNCVEAGIWKKSTASNPSGNCVEIGAWQKSSASAVNNCLEASSDGYIVQARDTKESKVVGDDAPVLEFGLEDWEDFILAEKGQHRITSAARDGKVMKMTLPNGQLFEQSPRGGNFLWTMDDQPNIVLRFTPEEIRAWGIGVEEDEFDLSPELKQRLVRI